MVIVILILLIVAGTAGIAYYFGVFNSDSKASVVKTIVDSQRNQDPYMRSFGSNKKSQKTIMEIVAEENEIKKSVTASATLEKKLRYAQWTMQPTVFYILMVLISLFALLLISLKFNLLFKLMSLFVGPFVMNSLLNGAVFTRFKKFDNDYPSFLLSFVGLLKTGMNPIQGLKAASDGLEPGSLVKYEIDLMLERLRIGIPEDQSIGAFGEDIAHEEIELFVQALLLSRKVGGNLSDTLDRLARQVRKRQYFRSSAHHAVGMQRGSIWLILGFLVTLLGFMYAKAPELIADSVKDDFGWEIWQIGMICIVIGVVWIRLVTKIRA
jgi:tight adherence protein B